MIVRNCILAYAFELVDTGRESLRVSKGSDSGIDHWVSFGEKGQKQTKRLFCKLSAKRKNGFTLIG